MDADMHSDLPETAGCWVVLHIVKCVDLPHGAKTALEVVNDCARHERLTAVGTKAWSKVNIMVDRGLLVCAIGKV